MVSAPEAAVAKPRGLSILRKALARWALQGNALRQKRPQPATTCAGETPLKDGVDDVLHVLRYDCFRAEHLLPHWSGSERLQQMPYLPVALEQ
ncbi:hypothetical protein AK812_SmicGene40971 [Symbiodinium microadriaticum]|uniref:Uncharacterized protein n=1 Tax=Symbiodinium microadriaticum TaxID=2951 RepID=A0A1Q9C7A7_SYMMI|nr:hypothetical protein AK812_SmicGene40971 [Symbiodinium microadriaticum]